MKQTCSERELVYDFVSGALSGAKARTFSTHLATCPECAAELARLRSFTPAFAGWPSDILAPSDSLWERLSARIGGHDGDSGPGAAWPVTARRAEWRDVAPGISYKLLARDFATDRVSMLVRLAAGMDYPPHRHAGVEELHLLEGELIIDDRTLHPGDFYTAAPGTVDSRVWTRTGCTCVLMASLNDELLSPAV